MDDSPVNSQTIEEYLELNKQYTSNWTPPQSTYSLGLAPRVRAIMAWPTKPTRLILKVLKRIGYGFYRALPSFTHPSIRLARKRINSIYSNHILIVFFNKWSPLVKLSSECSSQNKMNLIEESIIHTTLLSVFPTNEKHCLGLSQDSYFFPEIYIATIEEDTIVSGGTNLIRTKDKVLYHDLYNFEQDYTSEECHLRVSIDAKNGRILWRIRDKNPYSITTAASFVDSCARNYSHWITEVLPRIALFCSDNRFDGIPIIVNDGLHKNLMTSLFLITGANREIITLPIGRELAVTQLFIVSPTGYIPFDRRPNALSEHSHGVFSPFALTKLRDQVFEKCPRLDITNYPKKIYLRRNTQIRKLINETEVEEFLVKKGFVIITTESVSFVHQVALFQNAEVVIGPTGAAFANIVFCNPQVKLVILMGIHKNMPYKYWKHMANAVDIKKISYVLGQVDHNLYLDFHADFKIQINDLLDCLNLMEIQ